MKTKTPKTPKKPKVKLSVASLLAKTSLVVPADLSEAQAVANEYAETKLEHDKLIVKRDEELKEVTDKYSKAIEERAGILDRCYRKLMLFFANKQNRERLLGDKQSVTVSNVMCSFRVSPGKVDFAPGKKADDIVMSILASGDNEAIDSWLNIKPTLDKNNILRDWPNPESRALLESLGIVVTKDEDFDISPLNRTDIIN